MWRDTSASTSISKPNAWGNASDISRRSQLINEQPPGGGHPGGTNTNGGHIPSSSATSVANSVGPDGRLPFGRMFAADDMAENLFGPKGTLEDAMERLHIVSVKSVSEVHKEIP